MISTAEFTSLVPISRDVANLVSDYVWFVPGDWLKFDYLDHPQESATEFFWRVGERKGFVASDPHSEFYPAANAVYSVVRVRMLDAIHPCFVASVAGWKGHVDNLEVEVGDCFDQETISFVEIRKQ